MVRSDWGCHQKWLVGAAIGWVAVLSFVVPASAQEKYKLDEDVWKKQAAADPGSPAGQVQAIRKAMAEERFEDAQKMAEDWIAAHPNHPLLVEAYLLRGDAKSGQRDYYSALYDYEYVIREYPSTEQFNTALEREYEIARLYAAGVKRKFLGMEILPAGDDAIELLIRIQERAPGSELGEKASLTLSDYYFESAEMENASDAYDLFLQNYPRSAHRERVLLRLIQTNLAKFKGPKFDATGLLEAQQRLKMYRQEYPAAAERIGADALMVRIEESLARKQLETAGWYDQQSRRVSAVYMYQRVVRDHPRSAAAEAAAKRLEAWGQPIVIAPQAATTEPAGSLGQGAGRGAATRPARNATELAFAEAQEIPADQFMDFVRRGYFDGAITVEESRMVGVLRSDLPGLPRTIKPPYKVAAKLTPAERDRTVAQFIELRQLFVEKKR